MTAQDADRRTKADIVYDALRGEILGGAIQPGEHLRQEDVGQRWGVSQTPVREAFRRLESEGLIEYEANRGVVVRGPAGAPGLETLARRWTDMVVDPDTVLGSDFP